MKDERAFAMAGLWERWHGDGETIETFTIITGGANELVKPIHGRMPVILPQESWDDWLAGGVGKQVLVPYDATEMKAVPISTRINNPTTDDPSCIEPIN